MLEDDLLIAAVALVAAAITVGLIWRRRVDGRRRAYAARSDRLQQLRNR